MSEAPVGGVLGRALLRAGLVWFLVILALAALRAFAPGPDAAPWALLAALVAPPAVVLLLVRRFADLRRLAESLSPQALTLVHAVRLAAAALPLLAGAGVSAFYAVPAAWGGALIGATAFFAAFVMLGRARVPWGSYVVWHALGLMELALSALLLFLGHESAWGVFAPAGAEAMLAFPLVLVPAFLMPFFAACHLLAIRQAAALAAREG